MIAWRDGIEHVDGAPVRELVQPNVWTSSVWISRDGAAFRKYFNTQTRQWSAWEDVPFSLDHEMQTRLGVDVGGWKSVATAVATAWCYRAPNSRAYATMRGGDPSTAAWNEPELDPEEGDFRGETWKPLRWRCGAVDCDPRYEISSHGRLRNPRGEVTRGFAAHGTRWAACKGTGLVDLLQAAHLVRAEKKVAPRIYHAYCAVSSSVPVHEYAVRMRLTDKLAWDHYNLAAPLVHRLHVHGRPLVSPDVWRALVELRGTPVLGGRLLDLHPMVCARVRREIPMEELRFARTCVASE